MVSPTRTFRFISRLRAAARFCPTGPPKSDGVSCSPTTDRRDEPCVEDAGALRLRDRVLANEDEDDERAERQKDGGRDREAKNEPRRTRDARGVLRPDSGGKSHSRT